MLDRIWVDGFLFLFLRSLGSDRWSYFSLVPTLDVSTFEQDRQEKQRTVWRLCLTALDSRDRIDRTNSTLSNQSFTEIEDSRKLNLICYNLPENNSV